MQELSADHEETLDANDRRRAFSWLSSRTLIHNNTGEVISLQFESIPDYTITKIKAEGGGGMDHVKLAIEVERELAEVLNRSQKESLSKNRKQAYQLNNNCSTGIFILKNGKGGSMERVVKRGHLLEVLSF